MMLMNRKNQEGNDPSTYTMLVNRTITVTHSSVATIVINAANAILTQGISLAAR